MRNNQDEKKYRVKYEKKHYVVSFGEKMEIEHIKLILFAKRQWRRAKIVFAENNLVYCFIVFGWSFFIVISWIWGQNYKGQYTISDTLWDLKNPIFSSVILALIVSGYNKVKQYRRIIRAQHYFYTDSMYEFESILPNGFDVKSMHYIPYYNELCLDQTKRYIHNHYVNDNGMLNRIDFLDDVVVDKVYKRIEKIEEQIRKDEIVGTKKERSDILYTIDRAKDNIQHYKTQRFIKEKEYYHTLSRLYEIIELLRRLWRTDIKYKMKVLYCLSKYPQNEIDKDYYYSMLLFGSKEIAKDLI